jgi:mannose-6-phosphate isomerase-like protein (cupin superfamily)
MSLHKNFGIREGISSHCANQNKDQSTCAATKKGQAFMSKSGPALLQPNEGKKIRIFGGVEFLVKVSSQDSGGAFTLLDSTNPVDTFLPPHVRQDDLTFYVQEGEFAFQINDQSLRAGPGTTVYVPQGTAFSFKAVSSTPVRALVLATPGGFERCLEELSTLEDPSDMSQAFQVCARYGIKFLPPPAS